MSYCELKWCVSGPKTRARVFVNEIIGDGSFNTGICSACARALGLSSGDTLPDADVARKALRAAMMASAELRARRE